MAIIGQQLLQPEVGWKRYDDTHPSLQYLGNQWAKTAFNGDWNTTVTYLPNNPVSENDVILFKFKGVRLRFIAPRFHEYSANVIVEIDGVKRSCSQHNVNTVATATDRQILCFAIDDLSDSIHTIKIYSTDSFRFALDAIDINSDGYLLHPDEVTNIKKLVPGKRIRCHYQATANSVGLFSNLGKEVYKDGTNDFISIASSANPNGCFYFLCVGYDENGKLKLVADRNVQHSISWDKINEAGFISGKEVESINLPVSSIPVMTSNTLPSGVASASSVLVDSGKTYSPFLAFNNNVAKDSAWATSFSRTGWLSYKFDSLQKITAFSITSVTGYGVLNSTSQAPRHFTIEGKRNNEDWKILGRFNDISWISEGETKIFSLDNNEYYLEYRLNGESASSVLAIASLGLYSTEHIEQKVVTIRSLSGGISSSGKNNEWDKIIVESNLNNTIAAGDNLIWNWNGVRSWTSTSDVGTVANRICRGGNTTEYWSQEPSSTVAANIGFRPVLIIDNVKNINFIIKNKDKFYTIKDSTIKETNKNNKNDYMNANNLFNTVKKAEHTHLKNNDIFKNKINKKLNKKINIK